MTIMKHLLALLLGLANPNPNPPHAMTTLSQYLGDSRTHTIALAWEGAAYTPGVNDSLLFTAKSKASDPDASALIQKITGAGIVVSGTNALVSLVPQDTAALGASHIVWDVQATDLATGDVRTVAEGRLTLNRDVSRSSAPSVAIHTAEPPVLLGPPGKSAYQLAVDGGYSGTQAQWLDSLGWATTAASTAPDNASDSSPATLTLGTGSSAVTYTAVVPGTDGNLVSVSHGSPVTSAAISVQVEDNMIDVRAATKAYMVVTGITNPLAGNQTLRYTGTKNAKPAYASSGLYSDIDSPQGTVTTVCWIGYVWRLRHYTAGVMDYDWYTVSEGAYPSGLVEWTKSIGDGEPTITAAPSMASDVPAAISATPAAAALVTAVTSDNDDSGEIAQASLTALSGAVPGTPGTPGLLGQEIIIGDADVYKCVREAPVKWVKLN